MYGYGVLCGQTHEEMITRLLTFNPLYAGIQNGRFEKLSAALKNVYFLQYSLKSVLLEANRLEPISCWP